MGAPTMQNQPSTQPTGKGGYSYPASINTMKPDATTASQLGGLSGSPMGTLRADQIPSLFTGQPQFGKPNQYATMSGWDTAGQMMGGQGAGGGKAGAKGKGGPGGSPASGAPTVPFVAPTKFDVQFNKPAAAAPAPAPASAAPAQPEYDYWAGGGFGGGD